MKSGSLFDRRHCAVLLLLLVLHGGSVHAAGTLQSSASASSVARGDTVTVTVSVDALTPALGCFSFGLVYDPARLRFVDAVEGSLFSASALPTFFGVSLDTSGVEVVSDCALGYGTSIATPGELAVLRFETLADGLAELSYQNVALRDVDRALVLPVSADTVAVSVGVTGASPLPSSGWRMVATPNPSLGITRLNVVDRTGGNVRFANGPIAGSQKLTIYDLAGRLVRQIPVGPQGTGAQWDGRDSAGTKVAGGLYFGVLRIGETTLKAKILRLNG